MAGPVGVSPIKQRGVATLGGTEKVAALLLAMGRQSAASILQQFEPQEIRVVTKAAAELRHDSADIANQRHINRAVYANRGRVLLDIDPFAVGFTGVPVAPAAEMDRLAELGAQPLVRGAADVVAQQDRDGPGDGAGLARDRPANGMDVRDDWYARHVARNAEPVARLSHNWLNRRGQESRRTSRKWRKIKAFRSCFRRVLGVSFS